MSMLFLKGLQIQKQSISLIFWMSILEQTMLSYASKSMRWTYKYFQNRIGSETHSQDSQMVKEGVQELHELGFVHRDLNPDNIVVNLRPLHAVIIDFDRAASRSQKSTGSVLGTPDYMPNFGDLRGGSTRWDVWALPAIILEADMETGVYRTASNERGSMLKAEAHINELETNGQLRRILNHTMLRSKDDEMDGLEFVVEQLKLAQFRKYKVFRAEVNFKQ